MASSLKGSRLLAASALAVLAACSNEGTSPAEDDEPVDDGPVPVSIRMELADTLLVTGQTTAITVEVLDADELVIPDAMIFTNSGTPTNVEFTAPGSGSGYSWKRTVR